MTDVKDLRDLIGALEGAAKCEDIIARAQLMELRATVEAGGGVWTEPPPAEATNARLLRQAASALQSLVDRNEKLEEALRPFANAADALDASWTSGNFYKDEDRTSVNFKAGTLRKARAALNPVEGE